MKTRLVIVLRVYLNFIENYSVVVIMWIILNRRTGYLETVVSKFCYLFIITTYLHFIILTDVCTWIK